MQERHGLVRAGECGCIETLTLHAYVAIRVRRGAGVLMELDAVQADMGDSS